MLLQRDPMNELNYGEIKREPANGSNRPRLVKSRRMDSSGGPKLRIVDSEGEFDRLKKDWNHLAEEADCHIFQTWEWNRVWWKYFGKRGDLHLITLYDGEMLVGLAPMFVDRVELFGVTIYRCLRFLGSNVSQPRGGEMLGLISYTDYLGVLTAPGHESSTLCTLARYFRSMCEKVDEILLDTIPENCPRWRALLPELEKAGLEPQRSECSSSQLISLDRSWSDFLKGLNKSRRYRARLSLKRVYDKKYKVFEIEEAESGEQVMEYFSQLVEMHQKRWNRLGSLGTFYEERNLEFHREIASLFHERGWLQLRKAVPAGEPGNTVAIDLNYLYKRRIYGVHTVSDDLSPLFRNGPGNALLNTTLKQATEMNILCYDFLRGDEAYKISIADRTVRNFRLRIAGRGWFRGGKAEGIRNSIFFVRKIRRKWKTWVLRHRQSLERLARWTGIPFARPLWKSFARS